MADNILNRDKHPEWNGERTKMVYSFPTDEKKWQRYGELRAESLHIHGDIRLATEFYSGDRYAIFEDDVMACRQLREYLERCPPGKGSWNLLTLEENRAFTKVVPGWLESNQLGRSACGLAFERPTADCLLQMERFVRGPSRGETMFDAVVIATLKSLGYKELGHYPSLLQHVGIETTLGNSFGHVSAFLGEE
jgi:hypothetical protein